MHVVHGDKENSKLHFIDHFYSARPLTPLKLHYKIWNLIELQITSYSISLWHMFKKALEKSHEFGDIVLMAKGYLFIPNNGLLLRCTSRSPAHSQYKDG